MKQKFFLILFALAFTFTAKAQIDVTVNPIALLFSSFSGGADIGFAEDMSVEPRVGLNFNTLSSAGIEYRNSGFGFGAIGKYYFSPEDGCDKWHVGPYLNYEGGKATVEDGSSSNEITNTTFGVGAYFGYKWVSSKNIVFDLGFGAGRNFIREFESSDGTDFSVADIPLLNISVIGKLAVGYRFGGGSK